MAGSPDSTDVELIKLLQRDGRQSSQLLGRRLGIHASTVQRRIGRLVESGIVRIIAVTEPVKAGLKVGASFGLRIQPGQVTRVVDNIADVQNITFLATTTGRFDAMGFAVFRDEDDLSGFIEKKVVTLPGVLQCETFVFLHVEKGRRVQFAPTNDSPDTKLIELLQEDGRQSATTLGKKLGVSPAIIRRRIRQLIKDGTIRTVAVVNISKIGMRLIAIIGLQVVPGKALQVQKVLAKLPHIKVAAGVTGRFDVLIWARFNSIEELSNFVEHDLGSMDGVKGSETFTCLRVARGGLTQL